MMTRHKLRDRNSQPLFRRAEGLVAKQHVTSQVDEPLSKSQDLGRMLLGPAVLIPGNSCKYGRPFRELQPRDLVT